MKKILPLVFISQIFTCSYALGYMTDEKIEIFFCNEIRNNSSNKISELGASGTIKERNYSLYLWGGGVRYYPIKKMFVELSSKVLLNSNFIGDLDTTSSIAPMRMLNFQQTSISINYVYPWGNKVNILGGVANSYIRSTVLPDISISAPLWLAEYSTWRLNGGIEYQCTKRLKCGLCLGYEPTSSIKYFNIQSNPRRDTEFDIDPISIETKLTLSF